MTPSSKKYAALFGTASEHRESFIVALAMLAVTALYQLCSAYLIVEYSINWFEVVGTWAGLVCVWLARTQNVLTWPWGIVSAAALGYFFSTIGLTGQQWLNWGYFLIIQVWAWPVWAWGGQAHSVLPVTRLTLGGRLVVVAAIILGTTLVYSAIAWIAPGSMFPLLDALVVASSVVAQFLLGRKKIESWVLWLGPVNLLSIGLFYFAGAFTVMALYCAFFIHACVALRTWQREVK